MFGRHFLPTLLLTAVSTMITASPAAMAGSEVKIDKKSLVQVVKSRSDKDRARDDSRNPIETLSFFKVAPGMVVAEALPGGGWYSNILASYLGPEGSLYALNYNDDMWPMFGFFEQKFIDERIASTKKFPSLVEGFTNNGINSDGFTFNSVPSSLDETVDRVLFIRALHNLSRFEKDANTLSQALKTTHRMLKKDGYVGVVQHQISESSSDASADGGRGYMKMSAVKKAFEDAGFEFVASSNINNNPKDKPSEKDIVWRLPPTYIGADNDSKKQQVDAIGESNRMTLLFKKAS